MAKSSRSSRAANWRESARRRGQGSDKADHDGPLLDLTAAAAALERGEHTSVEMTETALDRIGRLNPRLRALSDVTADSARREAGRADQRRARGGRKGPLAGIPITVKDIIDTTPAVCSSGLTFLSDHRPEVDAKVVRQLRRAGAVIVGVSASDPGAFGVRTAVVTHPQVPERTVGGSSGGSGAALAAGFAFAALGSDTGGSIRIPAACCAVAGLKPTRGRVSLHGVRPLVWSLDHVGPMTRSVRDLALVQKVLDPRYGASGPAGHKRSVRVGHAPGYHQDAEPAVQAGVAATLDACRELGAKIVEVGLPDPEEVVEIHGIIFCAESAAYHVATFADHWEEYPPLVRRFLDFAKRHTGADYVAAMRRRETMTRSVEALFEKVDVLVLPTMPVLPPQRDTERITLAGREHDFTLALVRYTCLFDHTGHPVVAMPVKILAPGLAASAQIVAPLRRDRAAVDFAGRLEDAMSLQIDYGVRA